jgi:hypothetical protein
MHLRPDTICGQSCDILISAKRFVRQALDILIVYVTVLAINSNHIGVNRCILSCFNLAL